MKITSVLAAAVMAMGVVAQRESAEPCEGQFILDACLDIHQPRRLDCEANDYECMCEESRNIRTCYNNCPNDPTAGAVDTEVIQWCNAMSATVNTPSSTVTRTSKSASSTTRASAATPTTNEDDEESTATADSEDTTGTDGPTSTSDSNSGVEMLMPKGIFVGALIAVAGLVF